MIEHQDVKFRVRGLLVPLNKTHYELQESCFPMEAIRFQNYTIRGSYSCFHCPVDSYSSTLNADKCHAIDHQSMHGDIANDDTTDDDGELQKIYYRNFGKMSIEEAF